MFALCQPRLGVMYHTMLSEDLRVPVIDDVRQTWSGPVALAEDLCVFDISTDRIRQRRAVVPDLAWPVPSHRHGSERPKMEHHDILPMSDWLRDAEIAVEGVETTIIDS